VSFRLATSLAVLRDEIDRLAPGRNKASDGTIGDDAHVHRASRHNPNDKGVVCALDITDDPGSGCPVHVIAEEVRRQPHPNLAYVISNRRIAGRSTGWKWHRYTGSNPHTRHAHFGVGVGPDSEPRPPYDDLVAWGVTGKGDAGADPDPTPRTLRRGSQGSDVKGLQRILIGAGHLPDGSADGVFGPQTEDAVKRLQAQLNLVPDGIVGSRTHGAIARLLAFLAATDT
jgi:hypothetical protein